MGITEGIVLGVIGSLHCVGMCGPLVLAVPLGAAGKWTSMLLYHGGRILVYTLLGMITGSVGALVAPAGFQQVLSIATGALILTLFLVYRFTSLGSHTLDFYHRWVKRSFRVFQHKKSPYTVALMGTVNGLLPCGLVYTALAASLAAGGLQNSSLFMLGFGTGTLPALVLVKLFGYRLSRIIPVKSMIPAMIVLAGLLLILRGMNLGIPYVSPVLHAEASSPPICR